MADSTTPNDPNINNITLVGSEGLVDLQSKLDSVSTLSKIRPARTAIGDALFGINHRGIPSAIPMNRDTHGMVFFTRPLMNMTQVNLRKDRIFNQLLTNNTQSLPYLIRLMLDTNLSSVNLGGDGSRSDAFDDLQAFIPMLTNLATSVSGFPDVSVDTYTSHPGQYHEVFSMVDDIAKIYRSYDVTVNFRNIPGDPVTALFFYWVHYMAAVFEGQLMPYADMIVNNEIDYQTRIYRLVLDSTRTKVQKIGATGASFPVNVPIGGSFDFTTDRPVNDVNHQISIQFRSAGAMYNDEILIDEFNRTVILQNPAMGDNNRGTLYTLVPIGALNIFNNMGYPRINPQTYNLEWYVSNDVYAYYLPQYQTLLNAHN